jgi:hypothetical protein
MRTIKSITIGVFAGTLAVCALGMQAEYGWQAAIQFSAAVGVVLLVGHYGIKALKNTAKETTNAVNGLVLEFRTYAASHSGREIIAIPPAVPAAVDKPKKKRPAHPPKPTGKSIFTLR